jgi:putative hemolysin
MVSMPETETAQGALDVIMREGHSRVPVFHDTIDNIAGILYARDLLSVMSKGQHEIKVKTIMRTAMFVPETKRVAELLRELQREKIHMAIVIDEYGSTAGLITIEDLLEEIVGEIYDEYDLEEKQMEPLGDDSVRVDARVPIDDVNDYFDVELDYPEVDSVGGLMLELFGRVPKRGETVEAAGLSFTIEKVVGNRVGTVRVTRVAPAEPKETGDV